MNKKILHIAGRPVTVQFPQAVLLNEEAVFGLYDKTNLVIMICSTAHPMVQRGALLHEACHAVFDMNGVSSQIDDRTEEIIVRALESGLVDVLRNPKNRWFLETLLGQDK